MPRIVFYGLLLCVSPGECEYLVSYAGVKFLWCGAYMQIASWLEVVIYLVNTRPANKAIESSYLSVWCQKTLTI